MSSINITNKFKELFNLRLDTDQEGSIHSIKANVDFKSENAWTLVFAIFMASVGLNINSTAVIIGAMLISPLMGPIVGIGLALGTYDFELLKRALRNLIIAVLISIAAATIYFLLSPIGTAQSELLARTQPSFFDVLIAFFGGAAGIIAISRKEKGNAIPGVAIATALMPPLCTAGFGIASGHYSYFFGALYLFIINSVFIAVSTFIFVRFLKFPEVSSIELNRQKNLHRWMVGIIIVTIIPSLVLVWFLQRENQFKSRASKFISQEMHFEKSFIVGQKIIYNFKAPRIKLTLIGETLSPTRIDSLRNRLKSYKLKPEMLEIKQASLTDSLSEKFNETISTEKALTDQLQVKLNESELKLKEQADRIKTSQSVTNEISAFLPSIDEVFIVNHLVDTSTTQNKLPKEIETINVRWKILPSKSELKKVNDFLKNRLNVHIESISHSKRIN